MDPQSVHEWCALAVQKRDAAQVLLSAGHFQEAWICAGFAVECAVKAAIFKNERFNSWPSRSRRPDLYVHDLYTLFGLAGINLVGITSDPVAPKIMTVCLWQRSDGYKTRMPGKVARDICSAAFDVDGVLNWISIRFQIPF